MSNTSNIRRQNFVRLAEKRVTKVLKGIRLIGNLSNRKTYEYSSKDIEKMFRALDRELKNARARFDSDSETDTERFKL